MFDISFGKLLLIAIVALIVVGPERLPKVARTMGLLFGRAQRYFFEIKADINNQLRLEELRKIETELREKMQSAEHVILEEAEGVGQELRSASHSLNPPDVPPPLSESSPPPDRGAQPAQPS